MNNLTPYENYHLNESAESGPMGFVISFNAGDTHVAMSYTLAGVFNTFYDFAQRVNADLGFGDEKEKFKNVEDLMSHVYEASETREGDYSFWHGFVVKPGAEDYNSESNMNCYQVTDMLEKMFVNPRDIMTSKAVHEYDLSYITRSIERDPGKLLMYEDDQEMYAKIVRLLNWDKRKIDALITVNRIKGQF